ncbi:hypothetical protein SAMN05877809_10612 [Rhodobacter sp. JA431]|uniref:hypothetical protein n=1 Tax=Rhodobacter sp. JA431 TaxID=570013 RepID=UPI000BC78A85|nr:hypothetical protein [Rhodobacter sp. JA431]SOC12146.1 hypothetical protein SAMN05877809_10612 [Rhodobacter sp. JA431]
MQLVFHLGAHATDEGRLIRTLAANPEKMAQAQAHAPAPGAYRTALRDALLALKGGPADEETQENLRTACLRGASGPVERLVFSYENFLALPDRTIGASGFYPSAADKLGPLANLFPEEETEFHLGLINPAVLIAALMARQNGRDYTEMMAGQDPLDLRWGPVVARMAEAAARCDAKLVLWCNEDLPLIFPEVLRAMSGIADDVVVEGEMALVEEIMEPEGVKRLRAYVAQHPPLSVEQRRKVLIAFLDKFARPEALEAELPLPGWTDELVAEIGAAYDEDIEAIAQLPGVTLITP